MRRIVGEHLSFWTRERLRSLAVGIAFIAVSLFIQARAGHTSARKALTSNYVHDAILDALPVVDLDAFLVQGAMAVIIFSALLFLMKPRYLLFSLKAVSLFLLTRSLFINLTNIGIYPDQELFHAATASMGTTGIKGMLGIQGDYFFSGHTGLPMLIGLIFWENRRIRAFFLSVSFIFAAAVLFAHVHYSIDVFAAPFITYGIFRIAERFFPRDYGLIPATVRQEDPPPLP